MYLNWILESLEAVCASFSSSQSITKEIAAIKNREISGWQTLMSSYILCKFWVFRREFLRNYRYVGLKLLKVTEIVIPFQYWEILFSSGNDKPMYPGYQMFFLACDEEGRYVFGQRPKTPVGHFLRLDRNRKPRMKSHWQMMRQKTVNKDSPSHYFRIPHNTLCCPPNFACYCP